MKRKGATIVRRLSTSPLSDFPSEEKSQQSCLAHVSHTTNEVRSECAVTSPLSCDGRGSPVHFSSTAIVGSDDGSVYPKDEYEHLLSSNHGSHTSIEAFQKPYVFHCELVDETSTGNSTMIRSPLTQVVPSQEGTRRLKVSLNSPEKRKPNSVTLTPVVLTSPQCVKNVFKLNPQDDVLKRIRRFEWKLHHTVGRSTGTFKCGQSLNYPLEDSSSVSHLSEGRESANTIAPPVSPTGGCAFLVGNSSKELLPQHLSASSPDRVGISGGQSGHILSLDFREPTFPSCFSAHEDFFPGSDSISKRDFNDPFHLGEPDPPSVTALAMTVLYDPANDMPSLAVCLGDCNGHIEYFELLLSSSRGSKEQRCKHKTHGAHELRRSGHTKTLHSKNNLNVSSVGHFVGSKATLDSTRTIWGHDVVRRHRHKAHIKSINALTSVAVEPYIKCLTFVNPLSSPNRITYLSANDRVIKLFQVRREGISVLDAFPYMSTVLDEAFFDTRHFPRSHGQTNILPIKEYGPLANSIQSLSVSADCETFMSVEDLQVFWWHFEAPDTTKPTCIVDLQPRSGLLDEIEELITASCFHPNHGSLFLLSRSSGILNLGDLRHPPSRETRQYAITTQITPQQNPTSCSAYDEILCGISAAAFLSPDHIVTRDYLSLKLWDLRKAATPCDMVPVMDYIAPYLDALYRHDSIFDRFPVSVDDVSGTVVTGLYDGAVAVWQPLSTVVNSTETMVHYRVDPFVGPVSTALGGRVNPKELEGNLISAWERSSLRPTEAEPHSASSKKLSSCSEGGLDQIPEPFTNKVLSIALTPGGERFSYVSKNGQMVYMFERVGKAKSKKS